MLFRGKQNYSQRQEQKKKKKKKDLYARLGKKYRKTKEPLSKTMFILTLTSLDRLHRLYH